MLHTSYHFIIEEDPIFAKVRYFLVGFYRERGGCGSDGLESERRIKLDVWCRLGPGIDGPASLFYNPDLNSAKLKLLATLTN